MRQRIVFFGSPEFAVPSLQALAPGHDLVAVVSQPDRPAGRGKHLVAPPVKTCAQALGVPVMQPATLKDPEIALRLAELEPDLFVVVAYGRILPPALLAIPKRGPWNVHASLLPALRGAAPIQWAIIRGETRSGVCIMQMEAGLDTGPVAACAEEGISEDDTAGSLAARLAQLGARLLVDTVGRIAVGTVSLVPQDHTRATLAPMLDKEDGRLDFAGAAAAVSAHARGVDPWPGASADLDGLVMKLYRPRLVAGQGRPGEALGLVPEGLAIACGQGAVAFAELQLPGRKRLAAAAVLAGHPVSPGTVLRGKV